MNKIIEKLYLSASEDDTFDTKETKLAYDCVYNAIVANASSVTEENEFFYMLTNYTISVESTAFEIGFKTALELFAGGNLS